MGFYLDHSQNAWLTEYFTQQLPLSAQNVKTCLEIVNGLLKMAVVCEDEPEEDDSPFGWPQQFDEDEEDPFAEQRRNSDSEEAEDREQERKKREFSNLQAQSKQDQL